MTMVGKNIRLTDRAMHRIGDILKQEPSEVRFRIAVEGGGCSGLQYKFDVTALCEEGDLLIDQAGARLVIDSLSIPYLSGGELDWIEDWSGSFFRFHHPNAASRCDCGVSFSFP